MYRNELMDDIKVRNNLKALDRLCQRDNVHASFILIGGAALILTMALHNKEIRATRDIDISNLKITKGNTDRLKEYFNLLSISTNADNVLFPPGAEILQDGEYQKFEDDYSNIKVYLVTPEMLVTIKALTDRSKDLEDIVNEDLLRIINPQKTIDLIREYDSYNIFSEKPEQNKNEILPKLQEMVYNQKKE